MIVDDEPLAVKMIENFIQRTDALTCVSSFNDPVKALDELDSNPVDIIFLDIQMPDLNGMQLSRLVPPSTKIIFTTAFKQYAYESYEVDALDFLLKPIRYQKFLSAIDKARHWFEQSQIEDANKDSMFIRLNDGLRQIDFKQILYISGMKDYVRISIEGEKIPFTTHLTMTSIEDMLPKSKFMRVNRSYIVSLDKIKTIDRNLCIYIGNEVIRVTDSYREAFNNYLKLHTAK